MIIIMFVFSVFIIKNANADIVSPENPPSSIETLIRRGVFSPQSYLSLKRAIAIPAIARDDASLLRFVDPDHPLSSRDYVPDDLVSLDIVGINQAGRSSYYRDIITPDLRALAEAFADEFGESLIAISAYRSANYQQQLWDLGKCTGGDFCSLPGRSEHQLGLSFDFFDASSEELYLSNPRYRRFVAWFQANAYRYGFTQSYQNGPILDGYEIEPWHWRYVGKWMAKHLYELGWSYTEYTKFIDNIMLY